LIANISRTEQEMNNRIMALQTKRQAGIKFW